MRVAYVLSICLGLAACQTTVPDSGVGFEDYNTYLRNREAQLAGAAPRIGGVPAAGAPAAVFSPEAVGAALDAADNGGLATGQPLGQGLPLAAAGRPRGNAPSNIRVESGEVQSGAQGISDEQDFAAVSARETIESDKQRRVDQQAQYQVIAPTALPQRSGESEPNIVQFALSTTHQPGAAIYKRNSLRVTDEAAACSRFGSPDQAQEAFLATGGPERDRKGLDQDGDGFACGWDPRPFRAALQ